MVQQRSEPDPDRYFGRGKLAELEDEIKRSGANLIACDDELAPRQERNLESALGVPVIDRTAVILDIFADHAHSAEGKLQVELAQLEYNLARMRGLWTHLERLGAGRMDGGIGTRGPGESQIETDRRLARDRISALRRELRVVERSRETMRAERDRSAIPTVALAGYTNAGKSTLLNAITGAGVGVGDRLFHTLDPTTRSYEHAGRKYLLTDTVGFIRKLPHQLVDAFKATLEETTLADLIVHVVDGSEPPPASAAAMRAVDSVLEEIGAGDTPRVLVFNKLDLLAPDERRDLLVGSGDAIGISAAQRGGRRGAARRDRVSVRRDARADGAAIPYDDGAVLSELHAIAGQVEREDREDGVARPRPGAAKPLAPVRDLLGRRRRRHLREPDGRVELKVRLLEPGAELPTRATEGDAGLDLRAAEPAVIGPSERASIGTGVAVEIPPGHAGLVLPRSGLALRHGISMVNAPGLIDSGYRGELKVLLLNTDREHAFEVEPGDRIAQLLVVPFAAAEPMQAAELSESPRGAGGFGSTGQSNCATRSPPGCSTARRVSEVSTLLGRSEGGGVGGVLEGVVERLELRARCPRGVRSRGRSARPPARRSWAAGGRAGRCRSGCCSTMPSSPSLPLFPCPWRTRPRRRPPEPM